MANGPSTLSAHAYSERLAAKTYADQLFLGQQEFAQQFRENMYMAGIQEIDEYPRVLSDSVMLPHNYRVVKTYEEEDRIDRFVNWVRSKIGFEKLNPRVIYSLERKDQAQKNPNEQVVLAGDDAPERPAKPLRRLKRIRPEGRQKARTPPRQNSTKRTTRSPNVQKPKKPPNPPPKSLATTTPPPITPRTKTPPQTIQTILTPPNTTRPKRHRGNKKRVAAYGAPMNRKRTTLFFTLRGQAESEVPPTQEELNDAPLHQ